MSMSEDADIFHFMGYPGVYFVKGEELKEKFFDSLERLYFLESLNECKFDRSPEKIISDVREYAYLATPTKPRELSIIDYNEKIPTRYESFDGYTQEEIDLYRIVGCGIVHASHGMGIVSIILIDEITDLFNETNLYERTMGLVPEYDSEVIRYSTNHIKYVQTDDVKRVSHKFKKYLPDICSVESHSYQERRYRKDLAEMESNKKSYLRTSETINLLGNRFKCSSTSLHCPSISNRCVERLRIGA